MSIIHFGYADLRCTPIQLLNHVGLKLFGVRDINYPDINVGAIYTVLNMGFSRMFIFFHTKLKNNVISYFD
ncbi:MAG: hypothetical protein PF541_01120 [Prolixibacteraceae bacterium]|nr:hypothetical protein [Prolixibacteraceae bacterium]